MVEQLTTFVEMMADLDLDAYVLPEPHGDTFRALRRLRKKKGNNEALLEELQDDDLPEVVRVFAVGQIDAGNVTATQLEILGPYLLIDKSISVRVALVKKLQRVPLERAISWLLHALIESQNSQLRMVTAESIRYSQFENWEDLEKKVNILFQLLAENVKSREHLDIASLTTAITPPPHIIQIPSDRFRVTDILIHQTPKYYDNLRLVRILVALIVESCDHDFRYAMQRIDRYADEHDNTESILTLLRSEIDSLSIPIELHDVLKNSYQKPLEDLHDDVRGKWKSSVFSAQVGLWIRLLISIFVAIGALWLLCQGAWNLTNQNLWPQSFLRISLGLVLLIISLIHRGSVRDTRQTLIEIGVANTVYATFAQQRLNIGHQHAALSLQNRLTTDEVKESSQLLSQAMKDAVQILRNERKPTTINEFLAQLEN